MNMNAGRRQVPASYHSYEKGSSQEEQWRKTLQEFFETAHYPEKVLQFERMGMNDFKTFNQQLKDFIRERAKNVNSTKLRKIFEIIKNAKDGRELLLAIPRLAYIVGREDIKNRDSVGLVITFLSDSILALQSNEDREGYKGIQKCAEAMVAYQKYYSDK
ncbi:MAG: type III-A CRISPR-associated protein Csm2 [Candidatus Atribacteria bacterium]|nr:type III-A CRISPR-associated protein Csm2 [Candidatus Atribacteria bacterium]